MGFQNADAEAVVPELIISSRTVHHSVLFEWKEGANTEADQLRRYNRIVQQDLTQRAMLDAEECATHNVTIVGLHEFRDRIILGVDNGRYTFPVLIVTDGGMELARNTFSEPRTHEFFSQPLVIDWDTAPTSFFPLDGSSEPWEYAEHIIPWMLTRMETGDTRIVSEEVARHFIPLWDTGNDNFKTPIRNKIVTVLTHASQNEFGRYIRRNQRLGGRIHFPTWQITENPLLDSPDRRLKVWHQMRKLQQSVIEHFRGDNRQEVIVWPEGGREGR